MGRACGRRGPQKHSKTLSNLFLFWFSGQPHHSNQQDRLDGPSPRAPRAQKTFKNSVKPLYFVTEASNIIPASRIVWMGRARGCRRPRKHSKTLSNLYILFRGQPHHSSQQDRLDGLSSWELWASETFKNLVKPLYFVSEASHIIPASRIGWMGRARWRHGPQKHSQTLSNSNLFILLQRPATSFQPAGSVKWAEPMGAAGQRNILKPCQTSFFFVSEASHIIPASRIGWMGLAPVLCGPKKHSKNLSYLFILFQRPATSFQPAGSVGWV
jgi:hypothetical protein